MKIIIGRISKITISLLIILIFVECKPDNSKESEILAIPLSIIIERFDQKFHRSNPEIIPELKNEYPFLFPQKFSDSVWVKRQKDSLQLILLDTVESFFPEMTPIENELENLFKHLKYYFPKTKTLSISSQIRLNPRAVVGHDI